MPHDYALTPDHELVYAEGTTPGVCVTDLDGKVIARWGEHGDGPGQFAASPHSLAMDSR